MNGYYLLFIGLCSPVANLDDDGVFLYYGLEKDFPRTTNDNGVNVLAGVSKLRVSVYGDGGEEQTSEKQYLLQ